MIHKRSLILIGVCAGIITRTLWDAYKRDERGGREAVTVLRELQRPAPLHNSDGAILGMSVPVYIANFGDGS